MLADSPIPGAEEWAFHDFDGFHGMTPSEHKSVDDLASLGALIEEHGEAYAAYAGHVGTDYATPEGFQDAYHGEWDNERDFAENLFDELYLHEVPEHVQGYDAFARDLFCGDYASVDRSDHGVFVFTNS